MNKTMRKFLYLSSVIGLVSPDFAQAIPFSFEARSLAMGGTNVATADLATAAWANPAMLSQQRLTDDFALLVGAGAFLRDDDNLAQDVKDFQAAEDRRQAAIDQGDTVQEGLTLLQQSAIVRRIDGKVVAPEVTGAVSMAAAFDSFSMAISARGDVIAAGTVTNLACALVTDPTCTPDRFRNEIDSENYNTLDLEGVLAIELAASFSTDFNVFERKLSVGVRPKIVDLRGVTYSESIKTVSVGLDNTRDEDQNYDIGTFKSMDLGFAYDLSETVRLGLDIRNLITDQFKLKNNILNFDTTARMGVAYHNSWLTLAADYDLTEVEPLLANPLFDQLKTQFLNVGAEFNAFDYAQLRLGASKNVASGIPSDAKKTAYTAGIGFWLGFNLDVAVRYTPSSSYGGFLQTGFRF